MYFPKPDREEIERYIQSQENVLESDLWVLFIAEDDHPQAENLRQLFVEHDLHFVGGLFPRVIYQTESYSQGVIIKRFPGIGEPVIVTNLSKNDRPPPPKRILDITADQNLTALVLVDGLTSNICSFLDCLFNKLGHSVNYLGGGAGSMSLTQKPCLITKDGILEDAAIVAFIDLPTQLGVRHGWQKIYGPLVATNSEGNVIKKLNWGNAFDIYRDIVEQHNGKPIDINAFFDTAKAYPFGMTKANAEAIVRDPIAVNDAGELICVGEVPQNTVIDVLEGKPELLIAAAAQATKDCISDSMGSVKDCLLFDCISRVLFLEEDFEKELSAVQNNLPPANPPLVTEGALTLGEISSNGQGFLEFFNKTIVMGLLYEKTGAAP